MAIQEEVPSVKRGRGRPKARQRPSFKKSPVKIQPRRPSDVETLFHGSRQTHHSPALGETQVFQNTLVMSSPQGYETSPASQFHPTLGPAGSSAYVSPYSTDTRILPMAPRPHRRLWDVRLNDQQECISRFCFVKNDTTETWIRFPRILESTIIERSYMYAQRLQQLGYTYEPWKIWEYQSHFGLLSPIGFANIVVTKNPHSEHRPFPITVLVLPGGPPVGGVDGIIGCLDLAAAYGGNWAPNWSEEQYVLYSTGHGHDTFTENQILINNNYRGLLCPPLTR